MVKVRKKTVIVKPHFRKTPKGKRKRVKGHRKKLRKLGKKIRFKPVGTFAVGFDELGNFRGSRVTRFPKKKSKK